MTIDEMIERLEEYKATSASGGSTEIRLATQPAWPFEWEICGLISSSEVEYPSEENEKDSHVDEDEVIYICEGPQIGYISKLLIEQAY